MKKVIMVGGFLCMSAFCTHSIPTSNIIETKVINPNPVILLENEIHETKNWDSNLTDEAIQISYDDAQLLMKVAQAEAGDQGVEGMILVMQVILNRANPKNTDFPNSVKSVIYQPGQFDTVSNRAIDNVELSPEVHMALAEIEKGPIEGYEVIAFETVENGTTLEKYFSYCFTFKDHNFYTKKELP